MNLFQAERAVCEIIMEMEDRPDDKTTPLLFLAGYGKTVQQVELDQQTTLQAVGETWTDDKGMAWYCRSAFLVGQREARFMRPASARERESAGGEVA